MSISREVSSLGKSAITEARAAMEVDPTPFPEAGMAEAEVLEQLHAKLSQNLDPQRNWTSYGPEAHPFAKQIFAIPEAIDTYAVEFYREIYPGILQMGQECVRMIGSLLNAPEAIGYLTTGGTEANLMAIRLARNLRRIPEPEFIVPHSRHYTFDLAEELFGVRMRLLDVERDYTPRVDQLESLINENTVALVCSAPEAHLGGIDPVAAFAEVAEQRGLYLHVDAAVGGFLLPFMRRLGRKLAPFDFSLPPVMSMTVDPHKLGLSTRPTGAFIVRDPALLERAVPIDRVVIDTLTASGRPGSATAAAWSLIRHLGADGYMKLVQHQLELTAFLTGEISGIEGLELLRQPECNIVCFTSTDQKLATISRRLWDRGYAIPLNILSPYDTEYLRLYVHPLKRRESAEALIADLRAAVRDGNEEES